MGVPAPGAIIRVLALEAEGEQGKGPDPLPHTVYASTTVSLEKKPRSATNHVISKLFRETPNPVEGKRTEQPLGRHWY